MKTKQIPKIKTKETTDTTKYKYIIKRKKERKMKGKKKNQVSYVNKSRT